MLLADIQTEIQPLSKRDKLKLMRFLVDELSQEEELLSQAFPPGVQHAVWSPVDSHEAAANLQQLLKEHTT
jgi:hypothetical protein